MNKTSSFIRLARPQQWYKNLLIFAAAFFSGNFLNITSMALSFYGFIALCLVSSANYAVNDLLDRKRDKANPEKKSRPIASGAIGLKSAAFFAIALYGAGFWISYLLGVQFLAISLGLAVISAAYSLYLKNILLLDVISIAVNFVLRAIGGVAILGVALSPWFFMAIFFLAFFLVFGKRLGDIGMMGKDAKKYKPVLQHYDKDFLRGLIQVFLSCLMIIYGLYAFFTERLALLLLYPVIIYIFSRYFYLICKGSRCARDPEKVFLLDRPLLIASIIFVLGVFVIIYLYPIWFS